MQRKVEILYKAFNFSFNSKNKTVEGLMSFMTFLMAMCVGGMNSTLKNFALNSSKDLKSKNDKETNFSCPVFIPRTKSN